MSEQVRQTERVVRAFICIELNTELKIAIKEFIATLKLPRHNFVKWVNPDSIHLTLKFLGNTEINKLEAVKEEVKKIVLNRPIIKLNTTEVGCFPNLKRIRVLWLGLGGDIDDIKELQSSIDDSLFDLGFNREARAFAPHLTLARIKEECSYNERWEFAQLITHAKFEPKCELIADRISLMRSQLMPGGAVYTRLSEFMFT